jgi:hypothetical protein
VIPGRSLRLVERRHRASKLNRGVLLESALLSWRLALRRSVEDTIGEQVVSEPATPWS